MLCNPLYCYCTNPTELTLVYDNFYYKHKGKLPKIAQNDDLVDTFLMNDHSQW